TTPYQLGSQVIKFSVKPHSSDTPVSTPTSETYLREAMVKYLSEDGNEATFDFWVQLYYGETSTRKARGDDHALDDRIHVY
ncbi:MAG: hypothetical protein ACRDEA_03325, partial [Microcystaceae cyanobacterium]